MATEGPAHLLSLKVMRVSRPALANVWQPFYSSSPSFSAHSTASILSLQGSIPLPGHPKTLRDLTYASELLTLPSSFGSIQLGETFSSCLCINNEAMAAIQAISMKVEMQTSTSKIVLAEFGPDLELKMGETLEKIVHHEIKELGQHVLACTVAYRLPPSSRGPSLAEDGSELPLQTFRKFYKFAVSPFEIVLSVRRLKLPVPPFHQVTNPLSVKTKVHSPRSPSALLSRKERDKVFLEVHIQNLTQEAMWFERMRFECSDGWTAFDANVFDTKAEDEKSIFSDSAALMQPQDMRQYIYILTPTMVTDVPTVHAPGSVLPLGRLDISWRSSLGEPGRLLTSMLSRRIPLIQAPGNPASALPNYLKRNAAPPAFNPPRSQSPQSQASSSRPGTPPPAHRPGSPFRSRSVVASVPSRPQSPSITSNQSTIVAAQPPLRPMIDVTVSVNAVSPAALQIEQPFTVTLSLLVSTSVPRLSPHHKRILSLAIQHVQPPRRAATDIMSMVPTGTFSPKPTLSGLSTPSPTQATFNYALAHQKLLAALPRQEAVASNNEDDEDVPLEEVRVRNATTAVLLPPPFAQGADELRFSGTPGAKFVGSSAIFLPPITLSSTSTHQDIPEMQNAASENPLVKVYAEHEFTLTYIPIRTGFLSVGGLRVVLVEDQVVDMDETPHVDADGEEVVKEDGTRKEVQVLKEWETICEVWVRH